MKLLELANTLKSQARQFPDTIVTPGQSLHGGAQLRLKYLAATKEFRLQVLRDGNAPDPVVQTKSFDAWRRELQTFGVYFGAPFYARVQYQQGETKYAAVIAWADDVSLDDVNEMEDTLF